MDPFIGQMIMFAGNFAPRGWAFCEGQLLPISNNAALFSILGTTYGGDGRTTFGLPDLRGRSAIHQGSGPGLNTIKLGERGGSNSTTLLAANLPAAAINIPASSNDANSDDPSGNAPAVTGTNSYSSTVDDALSSGSIQGAASQPFNNMQPFLGVNYIIALQGIFPSRN